ncbi:MAG: HAMP domain-containing histidine kinase, partial [Proteobacteria bacterium]
LCREKFRYKGVDLRVGAIPDVNLICRPTELSQVLLNLLNNAFDAVEEAEANQSQRWVQVAVRVEGEWVSLTVTDSGTGIPETVASRMLEPFYTTKELGKGTGLGLSISKGIVETHGGQLYYDRSNPNTSFVVELKLAPSNVSSILKPDNDNASGY